MSAALVVPGLLALASSCCPAISLFLRRRLFRLWLATALGAGFRAGNPFETRPANLAATALLRRRLFGRCLLCRCLLRRCFFRRHPPLEARNTSAGGVTFNSFSTQPQANGSFYRGTIDLMPMLCDPYLSPGHKSTSGLTDGLHQRLPVVARIALCDSSRSLARADRLSRASLLQ